MGPVQALADVGGVSEETGRWYAKESVWLLDPKSMYSGTGDDGVVFCENNGGFEVFEEGSAKWTGRPALWISTALNATPRGFAQASDKGRPSVSVLPQGRVLRLCTLALRLS